MKSSQADFFATRQAVTVVARVKAIQRTPDPDQLLLPSSMGFLRHLLGPQSVHWRETANRGLVEGHRVGSVAADFLQLLDFFTQGDQRMPARYRRRPAWR